MRERIGEVMIHDNVAGTTFRCPVCGAECTVIAPRMGNFTPRCCNRPMVALRRRAVFYRCPVCGAEIMAVRRGAASFAPFCCNKPMDLVAA